MAISSDIDLYEFMIDGLTVNRATVNVTRYDGEKKVMYMGPEKITDLIKSGQTIACISTQEAFNRKYGKLFDTTYGHFICISHPDQCENLYYHGITSDLSAEIMNKEEWWAVVRHLYDNLKDNSKIDAPKFEDTNFI